MKIKIKLIFLGYPPHSVNKKKIQNWNSKLFEVINPIGNIALTENADLDEWTFSDENITGMLPETFNGDFLIAITSVPLQNNYYVRRFTNNRICVTFFEIGGFLNDNNIPLENLILRVLYSSSLLYRRYNLRIPTNIDFSDFTHDETRGCIFDMNGIKSDIIYSVNRPILCDDCVHSLKNNRVESNLVDSAKKELKKIKKMLYYRMLDFVREYPICAIILSSLTAVILGAIGSLIASYLWELIIKRD